MSSIVLEMIGFSASETGFQFSFRYMFVESSERAKQKSVYKQWENMKRYIIKAKVENPRKRDEQATFNDDDEHFYF